MGTVNPSQSSPGDTIEAADVNLPVNQLAAVINGGIETVNIADNAVTAAKVADGTITPSKWSNPYKFSAYRNVALNSAVTTFTAVAFDTELFDTNNNHATGVYTAPVNGFYSFTWNVTSVAAASIWIAALFINGSEKVRGMDVRGVTSPNTSPGSALVQLTAGDTVDIRLFANAALAIQTGQSNTHFTGFLETQT